MSMEFQVIPVIGIMWSSYPCTSAKVNSLIGSVESDAFWCGTQLEKVNHDLRLILIICMAKFKLQKWYCLNGP